MMKLFKYKKRFALALMIGLLVNTTVHAEFDPEDGVLEETTPSPSVTASPPTSAAAPTSAASPVPACSCVLSKKYMLAKDGYAAASSAIAVAGLGQVTKPGKLAVSVAGATFKRAHAVALGASYLSENSKVLVKTAVTTNNRSYYGASVGVTYTFD